MTRWPSHGPMPERLRDWCKREHQWAELALRAAGPKARNAEGEIPVWLDFVSVHARPLIEACMHVGIWEPVEIGL